MDVRERASRPRRWESGRQKIAKNIMPTACITQERAQIHLKSERLEVSVLNETNGREEVLREIPLRDVERLVFAEDVQITSQAMAKVMRMNIPISFLAGNGQLLGSFQPPAKPHGLARLGQYEKVKDGGFALAMSGRLVTAKLYNQRRVLQRLSLGREQPVAGVTETLASLDTLFSAVARSASIDELRGYEGLASARYFNAWAKFLPESFPFERRSTRPPHNPVNACISFGSTFLYSEMVNAIHLHGLDPALGLLHTTEDGRWSLALDLMEPFRPVLVEALALDLFSHAMVDQGNFEPREGGIYLNKEGRKKFILQYERRMERQFMCEALGHRTSLRQQIENQVTMFKGALEDPARFEPFLMN